MGKKNASKKLLSSLLSLTETFDDLVHLVHLLAMANKVGVHLFPRQVIPSFDMVPDENLRYTCILDREDYSDEDDFMSSVLALRIMESKIRLALSGLIDDSELLVWQKSLRIREDEINKNLQTFFKRLYKPI